MQPGLGGQAPARGKGQKGKRTGGRWEEEGVLHLERCWLCGEQAEAGHQI